MGSFLQILAQGTNDWLLYGAAGVVIVYMVVLRPLAKKKKKDPLEEMPKFGLSQQRTAERDMQHLLVELSEMARQVSGQLDTRAAKLDALIQEADEKIAELKQLQAGSGRVDDFLETGAAFRAAPVSPPLEDEPSMSRSMAAAPPITDSRHDEVYRLADAGQSSHQIAVELNRPKGEVELILALRPR